MQRKLYALSGSEWAWVAGLFEGEGCISFRERTSVAVSLSMTDQDVVERLDALVPAVGGVKHRPLRKGREQHHPDFYWHLTSKVDVEPFLVGIRPWLGKRRRKQADEALARLALNPGPAAVRTHCKYGHPLSGDNLQMASGRRNCRICRKRYSREYVERDPERARAKSRRAYERRKARLAALQP